LSLECGTDVPAIQGIVCGQGASEVMSIRSNFFGRLVLMSVLLLTAACSRHEARSPSTPSRPSEIKVTVNDSGPLVVQTSTAEFHVLPSGYVQGFLLTDGKKLTLDEPDPHTSSDYLVETAERRLGQPPTSREGPA